MRAVMAYMASRGNDRPEERDGAESRYSDDRQRQPNQYTRNNMNGEHYDEPEMRRRRDSRGRYMTGNEDMPEDARAYDARNEYQPQRSDYGRAESRYLPEPPMGPRGGLYDGGGIGFGTRDRDYETRSHYGELENDNQRQTERVGGTMWMEPEGEEKPMHLDEETADAWVRSMKNEDGSHPYGGRWTQEELMPMAQKFGIKQGTEKFLEFWVMTNAFYSDFSEVAKKNNITSPEFYGMLALAWMKDKDALPDKTARYYKYLVKKN